MGLVDGALLTLAEGLCHRFQRLTGRTNVWLALQLTNLSIVIYFVWAALWFVRSPSALRVWLALFFVFLLYGLTQSVFRTSIESLEASAYNRVARGLRNPRRVRDQFLRLLFLVLSLFFAGPLVVAYVTLHSQIMLLGYSLIVLTTVVLYLLACDPLPPCEGRAWAWVRGFNRELAAVPRRAEGAREPGGQGGAGMKDVARRDGLSR